MEKEAICLHYIKKNVANMYVSMYVYIYAKKWGLVRFHKNNIAQSQNNQRKKTDIIYLLIKFACISNYIHLRTQNICVHNVQNECKLRQYKDTVN